MEEKAYKLLAIQENISNSKAKELIDNNLVFSHGKAIKIARAIMPKSTKFTVLKEDNIEIFEKSKDYIVINKPYGVSVKSLLNKFKDTKLVYSVETTTTGVVILSKNDKFLEKAVAAYKSEEFAKEYVAVVDGMIMDEMVVDKSIDYNGDKPSFTNRGKKAITKISPISYAEKMSKIKVSINSSKDLQVRAHLAFISHPIVGDKMYDTKVRQKKRNMLHLKRVKFDGFDVIIEESELFDI